MSNWLKPAMLRFGDRRPLTALLVSLTILVAGCSELQRPKVEPFYAETVPPPKQELRWSNGKMPRSLDPARAAAAPETDVVRAIYEGLTDLDGKSLRETPGVADKWESSDGHRTWTFQLRKDARWSNGDRLTAKDFVRSWKRLVELRDKAANTFLFQNIVGMRSKEQFPEPPSIPAVDFLHNTPPETAPQTESADSETGKLPSNGPPTAATGATPAKTLPEAPKFGVEAIDDITLKVSLELSDKDFPKLVSHPIFRPVYGDGSNFEMTRLDQNIVTNGAFRIAGISDSEITLDRSDSYWNRRSVALERVRFVAANTAEAALAIYKVGAVDVVTNVVFEPLALKLLTPYEDFRRTAHSALNFYEVNIANPPFNDRRIREAMAIAIDREKLTGGDMEGTTKAAEKFFPLSGVKNETLSFNVEKARLLLGNAGYPGGAGFPAIRLVINRNEMQQRVARSVARMWKQNLNLDTVVITRESSELDEVRESGDFDLLRRGVVLPANDEMVNITLVFGSAAKPIEKSANEIETREKSITEQPEFFLNNEVDDGDMPETSGGNDSNENIALTEDDALFELKAIPLYFPASYSLVKPYIRGFETNSLDAPSLKEVSIDSNWRPK